MHYTIAPLAVGASGARVTVTARVWRLPRQSVDLQYVSRSRRLNRQAGITA
jgi:hypothetical protein